MKTGFIITFQKNTEHQANEEFKSMLQTKIRTTADVPNFDQLLKQTRTQSFVQEIRIEKLKQVKMFKLENDKLDVLSIFETFNFGTKYIHRIVPLKLITTVSEYKKDLCEYIDNISKLDVKSFKIMYESRLNDSVKDEMFSFVLSKLKFEVNLKHPEYVLIIQVCKNVIGVSFMKNQNFNFKIEK